MKATLQGHPSGAVVVPMRDEWTEPPSTVYVAKFSEHGRYLQDFEGVFGVPFRLVTREDDTPVVLPDGTVSYWYAPDLDAQTEA